MKFPSATVLSVFSGFSRVFLGRRKFCRCIRCAVAFRGVHSGALRARYIIDSRARARDNDDDDSTPTSVQIPAITELDEAEVPKIRKTRAATGIPRDSARQFLVGHNARGALGGALPALFAETIRTMRVQLPEVCTTNVPSHRGLNSP